MKFKLNRHLEIGILAVRALRGELNAKRTNDIAVEIGTSVPFLDQVMRKLRLANIVKSVRGPGGGFILESERKVTALEIAMALGSMVPSAEKGSECPIHLLKSAVVDAYLNVSV